ncbi:MAG: hypothetical protein ACPG32_04405 [Akkermansiaceae bacterium]
MIDPEYANSVSGAGGGRVFGYRLFHLTPRHVLGLSMAGSPYVHGGTCGYEDAILAARILSAKTEKQWRRAVLGSGYVRKKLSTLSIWLRAVIFSRKFFQPMSELKEWLDSEMMVPEVMQGESTGRKLSSPWLQLMVCRTSRESGLSLSRAWWTRFSDAAWANVGWQELDGAEIRLMDSKLKKELIEMGWEESEL